LIEIERYVQLFQLFNIIREIGREQPIIIPKDNHILGQINVILPIILDKEIRLMKSHSAEFTRPLAAPCHKSDGTS
ncbi:unnamed protein product, partial [marine sediment metagenome]